MPLHDTIPPVLDAALTSRGFTALTPVQTAVIDPALAGRDLLVSARTGSGKTVGFGLLMAEAVLGAEGQGPVALVVAPTRELAMQVRDELAWLYAGAGARVLACVGGMDMRLQIRTLRYNPPIVVGTPGRLRDLLERGVLDLSRIRVAVLDEADEMLDMGFRDELLALLRAAPAERRTLMFSATLPPGALQLAAEHQRDAARVAVATEEAHTDIQYRAVLVADNEREAALVNILRAVEPPKALVFANTREDTAHLHAALVERGFAATLLSGDFTQAERSRALAALRDGRARVLVATDVAARGLDLPTLDLVIHFDLPLDPSILVHRSGRTGRAGRKGTAVLLVPLSRRRVALRLLQGARLKASWGRPPSADEVHAKDQERLVAALAPEGEPGEDDAAVAAALLAAHDPTALVASFVARARARNPEPEELTSVEVPQPRPPERIGVWFAVNVGHNKRADPNWLVPMISRRGGIPRDLLLDLRIRARETRFLVDARAADHFERLMGRPDPRDPSVRFARLPPREGEEG